jgi:aldehyde dehydrogenase (NAD+)
MVSFTGSTAVGSKIMAQASPTVKNLALELGGKSACIALDDADLRAAVGWAVGVLCSNAGQTCAAPTRLVVPRARRDEAVDIALDLMSAIEVGDPWSPACGQGPQISRRQQERVLGHIAVGRREGGRCVLGGGVPAHLSRGFYVSPTLFVDVDPGDTIAQEEIFGPVLAVLVHDSDDDAVRVANASRYGLSGAVWSEDAERAIDVAARLRTGSVAVNGGAFFGADVPFGGYKQSGVGRERGREGFEAYLETKTVAFPVPTG